MSSSLVDSFASDFSPEKFEDDYQNQLRKLVESKIEHGDAVDTEATFGVETEAEGGEVLDLMEALRRSIAKNKSSETAPAADASSKRAPAKRKAN
jgi:DNA end-binding protein Ku